MSKQLYANYTIEDFDKFDCLKLSKGIYLLLFFVLRGYLVWIMSVTNMKDRIATIQLIFPQTALFYLSLLSGTIGLFLVLVISLRRPEAPRWVQWCWQHCRMFLLLALFFDFIISAIGFYYWHLVSLRWLMIQALVILVFVFYLFNSQRFALNIREFPQKLPE